MQVKVILAGYEVNLQIKPRKNLKKFRKKSAYNAVYTVTIEV